MQRFLGGGLCHGCDFDNSSNVDGGKNGSNGGVIDHSSPAGNGSGVDISLYTLTHWILTPGNGGKSLAEGRFSNSMRFYIRWLEIQ